MYNTRRSFLRTAVVSAAFAPFSSFASKELSKSNFSSKKISLNDNDVIVFQGDSITDAGRDRKNLTPNNGLGGGYALLTAANLLQEHCEKRLKIYNRGISGNKVFQLADRWDEDCLNLKPNVLSILVGVNDFWHTLTGGYKGTIQTYRTDYKKLLDRTKAALPEVKLIIGEPFGLRGIKSVTEEWYPVFDEFRFAAKEIAESYGAVFIPYQTIFNKALTQIPDEHGSYWTGDGVHPTLPGASLMSQAWLQTIR